VLCEGTWLRMCLAIGVRNVLRCERIQTDDDLKIKMSWSDFKCFSVKFQVSALVGVIIKVILQNARCNNKDKSKSVPVHDMKTHTRSGCTARH